MKSSINLGSVYRSNDGIAGYWMVMKIEKDLITYSQLFDGGKIRYLSCHPKMFASWYPILYDGNGLHPTVKARYDHERMRRLKKL